MRRFFIFIFSLTILFSCSGKSEYPPVPVRCSDGSYSYIGIPGGGKLAGPYVAATYFHNGLALVKDKDGWFYIGKDFNEITGGKRFREATVFDGSSAYAVEDGGPILKIGRDGEVRKALKEECVSIGKHRPENGSKPIESAQYDEVEPFLDDIYLARTNGKHGILDKTEQVIVSFSMDYYFSLPEEDYRTHSSVITRELDIDGLLADMTESAWKILLDPLTSEAYADKYALRMDEFGWKVLEVEENVHCRTSLMAFLDHGCISRLGVEYTLLSPVARENRKEIQSRLHLDLPSCRCKQDGLFFTIKPDTIIK